MRTTAPTTLWRAFLRFICRFFLVIGSRVYRLTSASMTFGYQKCASFRPTWRGARGVEGFCYWHYWFGNGRRILERPFQEVVESGRPDFPFCPAWANDSWSGIWHGSPNRILVKQEYPGVADERAHFDVVLPVFQDRRYFKVNGKPLFAILDYHRHPDPGSLIKHWQELAKRAGLPGLFFVAMCNGKTDSRLALLQKEFDAVTEFGPGDFLQRLPQSNLAQIFRCVRHGDFGRQMIALVGTRFLRPQRFKYKNVVRSAFSGELANNNRDIPTVLPGWDNTPRSGRRGVIFEGSTPQLFQEYVSKAVDLVRPKPREQRIIFLKAWNEWAEGNYVEPDSKFGHQYLEAIGRGLRGENP
jgi:Glycosyltransferase WbsX